MEGTTTKFNGVKTIFQRPDKLWPIEGKLLNDEQFEKLMAISDCQWIIIQHPNKITGYPGDPSEHINFDGLTDDTLRRIADEKELNSDDVADIVKNINHERN